MTRQLTTEETAALTAFAVAHGKGWKEVLACTYWYNARIWRGMNILHSLRNDPAFGPTGLDEIKLPIFTIQHRDHNGRWKDARDGKRYASEEEAHTAIRRLDQDGFLDLGTNRTREITK